MKKLIVFILPLLVLLFGNVSYAYSQDDLTKINTMFTAKYNKTLSNSVATQILNKWEEVKDTKPYGYIMTNNSTDFYSVFSSNAISLNSTSVNVSGQLISNWFYSDSTNRTLSWSQASGTYNGNVSLSLGTWNEFHVVPIDWDNPLYSVAIETPLFDVTYRNILYDQVDVPLNVNLNVNQLSDLYCEVMAEYTLPIYLQYRYSSNSFEASQYTRISKTIVSNEEMVLARSLNASGLYAILKNKYAECLQELPLSSVSIRFPQDFDAQQILNARQTYDELRQVCTVGGTAIKIYIRYFSIENDTQFVVGAWRIWSSTNPKSFGVELPSWYQPYIPASGETGTNSTTETDPDVVVIPSGGQTPTGQYYDPSINITVGSNVPNYPDYPTIASYNLDNMLVDTMNNVKGLNTFFGEFGSFLTVSFSFFPAWIWAIIGVGFGISIVVMFLKIL